MGLVIQTNLNLPALASNWSDFDDRPRVCPILLLPWFNYFAPSPNLLRSTHFHETFTRLGLGWGSWAAAAAVGTAVVAFARRKSSGRRSVV